LQKIAASANPAKIAQERKKAGKADSEVPK
jgi:hypothetical protein